MDLSALSFCFYKIPAERCPAGLKKSQTHEHKTHVFGSHFILVVDRLHSTACRRDHLSRHPSFAVVDIPNGIHNSFSGYDLTFQRDIRLGSADDSAVLILIIILLFARNVNRTDDITVAIVDIEKLRTS